MMPRACCIVRVARRILEPAYRSGRKTPLPACNHGPLSSETGEQPQAFIFWDRRDRIPPFRNLMTTGRLHAAVPVRHGGDG